MLKEVLHKLVDRQDISELESYEAMNEIMAGKATSAQVAAFITALRLKGETPEEIAGCAKAMRDNCIQINPRSDHLVDTCGTGGDGLNTFNISTTAAFVAAGAGVTVAKHGNRSISSRSGSADVLEALDIAIDLTPEQVTECINQVGIGFMFAPTFHPAMRHAMGPRRELGFRSVFNILGPLTNPASAKRQVLGVYDRRLTGLIASALKRLGAQRVFVVHGDDGADELTLRGTNHVTELSNGTIQSYSLRARDLGLREGSTEELSGAGPEENARITLDILSGKDQSLRRDVVLLNAGAAIAASSDFLSLAEGVEAARVSIDSGAAYRRLQQLQECTQSLVRAKSSAV